MLLRYNVRLVVFCHVLCPSVVCLCVFVRVCFCVLDHLHMSSSVLYTIGFLSLLLWLLHGNPSNQLRYGSYDSKDLRKAAESSVSFSVSNSHAFQ